MFNTLKAKHWQIFLFTIGLLPLFPISIAIVALTRNSMTLETYRLIIKLLVLIIFPILTIIFNYYFFNWLYSIAIQFQKLIPNEFSKRTLFFRIVIIIPLLVVPFTVIFLAMYIAAHSPEHMDFVNKFGVFFMPTNLFLYPLSFLTMPYLIYFVAKTLKTAELQRKTNLTDYFLEFVLILFFPIGIWILQPRVNALYKELEREPKD